MIEAACLTVAFEARGYRVTVRPSGLVLTGAGDAMDILTDPAIKLEALPLAILLYEAMTGREPSGLHDSFRCAADKMALTRQERQSLFDQVSQEEIDRLLSTAIRALQLRCARQRVSVPPLAPSVLDLAYYA
ncbi:hypothetical protein [Sandarakinorhabdus sp.]|uniref:hypothetical protein n=1 Tax=Sandarakinorhabdus sp. TaxID=1916663 RepID=UPI003F719C99